MTAKVRTVQYKRHQVNLAKEIRERHRERTSGVGSGYCVACREKWPCPSWQLALTIVGKDG